MKREQSRAGSRFAECEKSRLKAKILITLALLLTAVTGAWADGTVYNTTVALKDLKAGDVLTDGFKLTTDKGQYIYVKGYKKDGGTAETGDYTQLNAYNSTFPGGVTISESGSTYTPYADGKDANAWIVSDFKDYGSATMLYLDGYNYTPAPAGLEVTWNAATKTGTFSMPGSDVVLTPQYAPTAAWAEGDAVLAPTAIEGVIAGTTDAIVKAGTVVEGQGTVMYFATTEQLTAAQAAQANGWLSTLPTAANIADDGATVYVWYYIKGTDTPDGQEATAENTFNDSEICAQPLEVIVLSNKFDITFNAANANTIEAGKATVKVGETAAEVKEGKLTGVKMGSEVKMTAKEGYKFRKVEVKKAGAAAPEYADKLSAGYEVTQDIIDDYWWSHNIFAQVGFTSYSSDAWTATTITEAQAIALAKYKGAKSLVLYEKGEGSDDGYGGKKALYKFAKGDGTTVGIERGVNIHDNPELLLGYTVYYIPASN